MFHYYDASQSHQPSGKTSKSKGKDLLLNIPHVFVVQRVRAFYGGDKAMEIAGVFLYLGDANEMVRRCKRDFKNDMGLAFPDEEDEIWGFKWTSLGDYYDGQPATTGTTVGLMWEFDESLLVVESKGWYSCHVDCFPLL